MEIIVTLLLIASGILGGGDTAHGTAVDVESSNVVSTVSIGADGSLTAFAG